MPIFQLTDSIVFPHPSLAEDDGLLAIGGDLKAHRLIEAYKNGIFPWFNQSDPILWWSPNPRCVIYPSKVKISKSLRATIRKNIFTVSYNTCFTAVISRCAGISRANQPGTWITDDIVQAYTDLHKLGFAHSVECFMGSKLAGGLYGVSIGKIFYGESMFSDIPDASKVAFVHLMQRLQGHNFDIVDNQMTTTHLISLGAEEISRTDFLNILKKSTSEKPLEGWNYNK